MNFDGGKCNCVTASQRHSVQEKGKFFTDLRIGAERRERLGETESFVRGKWEFR